MGAIGEREELPHEPGSDLQWSESYAFRLYDPRASFGGSARLDVRPNEGAMEVELHFFLPDGGFVAARHVKPESRNASRLEVGGVELEALEPGRRWRIAYDGPSHSLASARDAGKPDAWRASRIERLTVDLEFEALHPAAPGGEASALVLAAPTSASDSPIGRDPAGAFEQAGRWSGVVWVSGDEHRIAAHGQRERWWGVLDWQAPRLRRRFGAAFGDDCAILISELRSDGAERQGGWIARDGRIVEIRRIAVAAGVDGGPTGPGADAAAPLPERFWLRLTDADGRDHEIAGEVIDVAPTPRARNGRVSLLSEAVARFEYDGRSGWGFAEALAPLAGAAPSARRPPG
ncbi:MAG TPA: hypothetical protein VFD92_03625 [Candidatus Binatia bacterium]|nr:hypothetical protein [Candidatus Binatia bacterium]